MRGILARFWAVYREAAAALVLLLAAAFLVALWRIPDHLEVAANALVDPPRATPGEAERVEAERAKLAQRAAEFERSRVLREEELGRLEQVARSALARAEAERAAAEAERRSAAEAAGRVPSKAQQEFDSNVDLLQRVDATTALAMMHGWTDGAVALHLRAMRPTRAAEIVNAMQASTAWQERLPRILAPEQKP